MKQEIIDLEKAKDNKVLKELGIRYAIFYYIDRVEVKKDMEDIDLNNLLEASIFGEKAEIKMFKQKGELKAILNMDEDSDKVIKISHIVRQQKFDGINKVNIKKYIKYDEDGQAYIDYWRPYELVKEVK